MDTNKIKTYQTEDLIIEIDTSKCISCGTCVAIAPKTFKLGETMISQVKPSPNDDKKTILEAAQSCMAEAIKITEKNKPQS